MVHADRVPEHDVGPLDAPIRARPLWQPHARLAQRRVLARRKALGGIVRRHPEMMIDERGAPPRIIVGTQ